MKVQTRKKKRRTNVFGAHKDANVGVFADDGNADDTKGSVCGDEVDVIWMCF